MFFQKQNFKIIGYLRKQISLFVVFVVVGLLLSGLFSYTRVGTPEQAIAATSSNLNIQARLYTASGSVVPDGYYNVEFKMYDALTSGSLLWTETWYDSNGVTAGNDNRVRVVNGYISVQLGSQTALPSVNWDDNIYISLNIGGTTQTATPTWDGEMSPRIKLNSVPFAQSARNLQSANTSTASTNSGGISIQTGNATGATSNSGNVTLDVGTATGTAGTISVGTANTSGITIGRVGVITDIAGNLTVSGSQFTNNGSTLNGAQALSNFASGGSIGSAATTVDVDTAFTINQTTAGQTLSLPSPTNTAAGRLVYVLNIGSVSFTMHGVTIPAGYGQIYIWNGSNWLLGASGGGAAITLQSAYDGGNTITTSDARDLSVTLANTSTDANLLVNIASGSTSEFKIQANGTDVLQIGSAGQLQLDTQGITGGILLGGDTNIYRSAANTLRTDDDFSVNANVTIAASTGNITTSGDLAVNGGDVTSTGSLTVQAAGTNTLTLNTAGAGTVNLGTTNSTTIGIGNTTAATQTTIQGGTGASAVSVQAGAGGTINVGTVNNNNLALNTAAVAGTTTIGGTGTTGQITIGQSTATNTIRIGTAAGASATQTINIGTSSTASSTTNVNIGSTIAGTTTIQGATTITGRSTGNALTVNNSTSTGAIFTAQDNGTSVFTISDGGGVTFKTTTNNVDIFNITNSANDGLVTFGTAFGWTANENLILNSNIENGSSGWSGKNGGSASFGGNVTLGSHSAYGQSYLTSIVSSANDGAYYDITLLPSTAYTLSAYVRINSGSNTALTLGRQDQSGTDVDCAASATITSSWQRISCTFTTGGTISSSNVYIKQTDAVSRTLNIDGIQLEQDSTLSAYNMGRSSINAPLTHPLVVIGDGNDAAYPFQVQNSSGTVQFAVDGSGGTIVGNDLAVNGGDLTTSATTFNLLNATATTVNAFGAASTLNLGPTGATAASVNLAGGSGATGCTVDGATGNLACSGNITGASTGTVGYWSRSGTTLQPATAGDNITTSGNVSTTGTGTITSAGLLTASDDLAVNGDSITTDDTTFNLLNTTATTINAFGAASTINLGAAGATVTNPGSLNIRATGTNTLDLDTTGAGTIGLGDTNATTIGIGNTTAATVVNIQGGTSGSINLGSVGSSTLASTVNIANTSNATGAQTINIGSAAANASSQLNIFGGSGGSAIVMATSGTGGIRIGGTAQTGTIQLGASSESNTISIGSGSLNASQTQTINIGNQPLSAASSAIAVNILSGTAGTNGTASLLMGNNDRVTQIDIGNVAADAARTLNFGTGNNTVGIDTLNIGTGNTTVAGGKTINIGTGTPSGSGTNIVTIGSIASGIASTTTIQGGNGSTAVNIQAAASGNINIGTNAVTGKVLNIGSVGSTNNDTTVHIADSSAAVQTVTIGSTNSTSSITLQAGSTGITAKSDSTTALRVQNAAGTSTLLNADTTNMRVSVGSIGTATGQLYVSGSVPTSQLGSISTGTSPYAIYVQGRYAYVVNDGTSDNLQIFDISNPASPVLKGSVSTGDNPRSVYVQGRYAYVANTDSDTLQIFDISNPASPSSVGSVATGDAPRAIYVQGRYAYVANYVSGGVQVFDISNPASPSSVGSVSGSTDDVFVQGRYAYTVDIAASGTLRILDISNPASPSSVGSVAAGTNPGAIYVQGRYAYVTNGGSDTLQIFDISNPASPSSVGSVASGDSPSSVYIQGRYAYVTNTNDGTLQVFDISNPASPSSVGTVSTGTWPRSISVQGRYAYIINGASDSMQVFDMGGAYTQQLEAGGIETSTLSVLSSASIGGNTSIQGGLTVLDSSNFSGALSVGSIFDVTGSAAFRKGTDFSTTGSSNNVSFGEVSLVRLTGASAQTITGVANGRDGEILTIVNAASQSATISNNSGSSSAANRIITGTGADVTLNAGGSITLIYDSVAGFWRVTGSVAFSTGNFIQNGTSQQTSANFNIKSASAGSVGAVIQGTSAQTADIFQLKDENNLNLLAVGANAGFAIQSSDGFTSTNAFTVGVVNSGVPTTIFGVNSTSPGVYTGSTTFSVFNTTATTINAFGAASTINLGAAGATVTNPGSLNIRATGTNTLDLDTTGAGTIGLGDTNATTIGIGNTTAATTLTLQGGTGSSAVSVQAGSAGTINIGTVNNNNVAINTAAVAGTTTIGGTGTTGQITIGQSTATNSIFIGAGIPAASTTQTISIGNSQLVNASSAIAVNILSGTAGTNGTASLLMGNNDRVTQIDIGNVAADAARTLNFGTGNNTVGIDTLNIGTGNTTVAGGKTINIGTGTPSGSGSNLVTIGSTALTSNTTIQGGSAGVTVKSGGATGSTTAFQIQNAAGTATYFSVDNSNSGATNIISIGGNNSAALPTATTTTALTPTLGAHTTLAYNGYVYVVGGYSGSLGSFQTAVYYSKVKADGSLDTWATASNGIPVATGRHTSVIVNGYLYVIGGTNDNVSALRTVRYAKINSDGSLGTWNTTADLGSVAGDRRWDAASVTANGYIYVIGGSDNTNSQDEIFYARPNADGTISSWSTESDLLPAARYSIAAVTANGYIYVYGGGDGTTAYAATYYTRINADPSTGTGAWSTDSDSNLNTARYTHGAFVSNGYVYAVGGATGLLGATTYASIEYAALNSDGTLGTWNTTNSLPANRAFMGAAIYNGYVYIPGGITGTITVGGNYVNTVYYTSTERIRFGGNLDLTSFSGGNGADGNGSGGSLTAGNTNVVGYLQVAGAATIANGLSVGGEFVTTGKATVKSATNSATAFQVQSAGSADTMLSIDTTSTNKVKIGNSTGTGTSTTVFQLDSAASAPFSSGQTAYLGSMYYDSTQGKLQCYENRNGTAAWGACGSAPNNIITLTPEYTGAVLNGTGVGTLTADFCSNESGVLVVGSLCANHEARNFYKWTSPQGTDQTYGIYVTYKLPSTFSAFNDANTIKLTALTDSTTNANATLQVFRKNVSGNTIVSCGSATTINNTANTWQQTSFGGDETACGFVGGDYVIFKINVTAKSSGNVYVENLDFTYTNQ